MEYELKITGRSNRSRYLKIDDNGDLYVNWEIYGDGPDGIDMETILIVSKSEFPNIKKRYGFPESEPLLEVLYSMSEQGRADQFIDELFDGTIPLKDKFVY